MVSIFILDAEQIQNSWLTISGRYVAYIYCRYLADMQEISGGYAADMRKMRGGYAVDT